MSKEYICDRCGNEGQASCALLGVGYVFYHLCVDCHKFLLDTYGGEPVYVNGRKTVYLQKPENKINGL